MAISFDAALGIHEKALYFRTQRAAVLANNLANADTPNYKARDIDFKDVFNQQLQSADMSLAVQKTNASHLSGFNSEGGTDLLYRVPLQPSVDGNTVEEQLEQAEFMKNAMQYEASFLFLNKKFKGMITALKGE